MRNKTECALVFGSVLYLCLFLFNSMTRTFGFPADSMNYVNVARNITQGLGISQSTLGFNQTLDVNGSIPTPMTSQAPLYPLLIAWVHKLGVEHADAALVLPVVAYAAIMALGFFLGSICYGRSAGLLSVAYLSCYGPLRGIARHALSDSLGIAFVLFALVLLFESRSPRWVKHRMLARCLAGVVMGFAFATRYSLLPLAFVGAAHVFLGHGKKRLIALASYSLGFCTLAVVVVGRNLIHGSSALPTALRSDRSLITNVTDAVRAMFGRYIGVTPAAGVQLVLLIAMFVTIALVLKKQHRLRSVVHDTFASRRVSLLSASAAIYLLALVLGRTMYHFDAIDGRLVAPAGVIGVVLCAGLSEGLFATPKHARKLSVIFVVLFMAFSIEREARFSLTHNPTSWKDRASLSPHMAWIAKHTTERDLIIGLDAVEVPFYLGNRAAVSFSPFPYTNYLSYSIVMDFVERNCQRYEHFYLVVPKFGYSSETVRRRYGVFLEDLWSESLYDYPGISESATLEDAVVFEVPCQRE